MQHSSAPSPRLFPLSLAAQAAEPSGPVSGDLARIEAELARVRAEQREQRQLILQLMQMHDALLRYVASGGSTPPPAGLVPPAPSAAPPASPPDAGGKDSSANRAPPSRGSVSGKVHAPGDVTETYVYVDGPRVMPPHPPTIEIKQIRRQFVPTVAVVQVGTRVVFPNQDKVFHNVFSRTPGDAFDLGGLKPGDRPNAVAMLKPGHVEVFCNIHSKMRSDILVVPSASWARVRADGTFQIAGVPVGAQRLVLWGPNIKPVSERVEVTPAGASVSFNAEAMAPKPHLNKQGGAYESYGD